MVWTGPDIDRTGPDKYRTVSCVEMSSFKTDAIGHSGHFRTLLDTIGHAPDTIGHDWTFRILRTLRTVAP